MHALVLAHGTYTNPVRTTKNWLCTLHCKPLIVALCLMVWLSPMVRVMNWLGYLNGSVRSTGVFLSRAKSLAGGFDFLAYLFTEAPPDGTRMLAVLTRCYDTLGHIPSQLW